MGQAQPHIIRHRERTHMPGASRSSAEIPVDVALGQPGVPANAPAARIRHATARQSLSGALRGSDARRHADNVGLKPVHFASSSLSPMAMPSRDDTIVEIAPACLGRRVALPEIVVVQNYGRMDSAAGSAMVYSTDDGESPICASIGRPKPAYGGCCCSGLRSLRPWSRSSAVSGPRCPALSCTGCFARLFCVRRAACCPW